jgi:hypothetical protein
MSASPVVLKHLEWNPSSITYSKPKLNTNGGKSVGIISTQSNRSLHISTPLMMTWGISMFTGDSNEADAAAGGDASKSKYSMTLCFPSEAYSNNDTTVFLEKMKQFEEQLITDAVKNYEAWWEEENTNSELTRAILTNNFCRMVKYSKDKVNKKKIDYSKPPSIRAKVPYYKDEFSIKIYDTKYNLKFPNEDKTITPSYLIQSMSKVACVLQCTGIWFIGKSSWGVTWKLVQCVVKPREITNVNDRCQIQLSEDEVAQIESQPVKDDESVVDETDEHLFTGVVAATKSVAAPTPVSTMVVDSDDESPHVEAEVVETPAAPKVKKLLKAKAPAAEAEVAETPAPAAEKPKKKLVAKK